MIITWGSEKAWKSLLLPIPFQVTMMSLIFICERNTHPLSKFYQFIFIIITSRTRWKELFYDAFAKTLMLSPTFLWPFRWADIITAFAVYSQVDYSLFPMSSHALFPVFMLFSHFFFPSVLLRESCQRLFSAYIIYVNINLIAFQCFYVRFHALV